MNTKLILTTVALSTFGLTAPAEAQRWRVTSQTETSITAVNDVTGAQAGAAYGPYGGAGAGYVNPNTGAAAGAAVGPNGGFISGRTNPNTGVKAGTAVGPGGAGVHGVTNTNTCAKAGVAWIPGVGFAAAAGGQNAAGYVA